jgi:hypothetical protein
MVTMKQATAAVAASGAAACVVIARRRQLRWGATDAELAADLPGDSLLPRADLSATRAITIAAPAVDVWPWIAQMGQGRGGLYSYDALENLVGCDIHSADRIVDEWQHVTVGDPFRLHPAAVLQVAVVDPGHALVVQGGVPMGDAPAPYAFTWAFVLAERADGSTRLVVRERYGYTRWWARLLVEPVEVVSFAMSRKMLHGIRDRAQRSLHGSAATATAVSELPVAPITESGSSAVSR